MFWKLVLVFGLPLTFKAIVDAKCNECSAISYASCINETAFRVCFDGVTASDQILICSNGHVCTNQEGVCKSREVTPPDCGKCKICTAGFACVSQTQFEYCAGGEPTGIIAQCPKGQYCNLFNLVMNKNICSLSCTSSPTCYAAEATSTPPPATEYRDVCTGTVDRGYYENVNDSSCKTFYYCEMLNGIMNSVSYNCTSGYFSKQDQKCVDTKPKNCT